MENTESEANPRGWFLIISTYMYSENKSYYLNQNGMNLAHIEEIRKLNGARFGMGKGKAQQQNDRRAVLGKCPHVGNPSFNNEKIELIHMYFD